jgi:hypothetical protein
MPRLAKIIQFLCAFFILGFVSVTLQSKVQAQGCQIYSFCVIPIGGGPCVMEYYDGCGDNWDYCPPNHYRAPDGSCRQNGASCPCGEFYACPTANNPGKMCAFGEFFFRIKFPSSTLAISLLVYLERQN